jgi:starch phosphorylase
MNEGHAAFLGLERIRIFMAERGFNFYQALQAVIPTNIFTTHTPVPAGNERFGIDLMERYFRSWSGLLGLDWKDFLGLGRENPEDYNETFCMTILALKLSAYSNGVSALHGEVSRTMWAHLWPGLPFPEVPITSITNGVHPRTWISHNMLEVLDRYFGPRFYEEPAKRDIWDRMDRISDEELWRTHARRRSRLVVFAREHLKKSLKRNGATDKALHEAEDILSPFALTIAFSRRFATYKRASLLLRDPERLLKLLSDAEHPIQLIFAGKAHPHDIAGKELIKQLVHFSRLPEVQNRIVFLENYDMAMARYMTAGADVWLNTPRRPMEASGTSGMKAGMNGVLNCSILDGWWAEAYTPEIGFAIGSGEEYKDEELQDKVESEALYDLLESEIIPLFYRRGRDGLPRDWIAKMKATMRTIGKNFSTYRMLEEYSNTFYIPALENHRKMIAEGFVPADRVAGYLDKARRAWPGVLIRDLIADAKPVMERGDFVKVRAFVELAGLTPEEVRVECYHGPLSSTGEIESAILDEMSPQGMKNNFLEYAIDVKCVRTGQLGYAVRVLPKHPDLVQSYVPGLVRWA